MTHGHEHEEHGEMGHQDEEVSSGNAKALWWLLSIVAVLIGGLTIGWVNRVEAKFEELARTSTDVAVVRTRLDTIEAAVRAMDERQRGTADDVKSVLEIVRAQQQAGKHQ